MSDPINELEHVDTSNQEHLCKIKDIKDLCAAIKSLFSDNAFGVFLFFTGLAFLFVLISLTDKKNLYTAGSIMMAVAGLFFNAYTNNENKKKDESEFFLTEIKGYFTTAKSYITEDDNTNIRWHNAIYCLKTAEYLSDFLTKEAHKVIFVNDYINTAYVIIDIINKIDSYKFFFGLKNYNGKTDQELFDLSAPKSSEFLKNKCYSFSINELKALEAFYDKAGKASYDRENNNKPYNEIFESTYFKHKIYAKDYNASIFGSISLISEYIDTYAALKKIEVDSFTEENRRAAAASES